MAPAALDPRIVHSFRIGEHLMVVSVFEAIQRGDALTLQATYQEYCQLRAFTGEAKPPVWVEHGPQPLVRLVR